MAQGNGLLGMIRDNAMRGDIALALGVVVILFAKETRGQELPE